MGPLEPSFEQRFIEDLQNAPSPSSGFGQSVMSMLSSPVVPSLVSGAFNALSSYQNRRFQERMMRQQRDWQLEDWRRTTEYNSPAAVQSRMRSAGLNSDLLVGGNNSNASMPAQGSAPAGSQSHPLSTSGFDAAVMAKLNARMVESEIAVNEATAENLLSEAEERDDFRPYKVRDTEQRIAESEARVTDMEIRRAVDTALADANVAYTNQQKAYVLQLMNNAWREGRKMDADYRHYDEDYQLHVRLLKAEIRERSAAAGLSEAEAAKVAEEVKRMVDTHDMFVSIQSNDMEASFWDSLAAQASAEMLDEHVQQYLGYRPKTVSYWLEERNGAGNVFYDATPRRNRNNGNGGNHQKPKPNRPKPKPVKTPKIVR